MSQLRFGWAVPIKPTPPAVKTKVELDEKTTTEVVALMARVLIAVARSAEEGADDR